MPPKRKHILRLTLLVIMLIVGIHIASALTLDRVIHYTEICYRSAKIGPELDGYVLAFITDTHALPKAELEKVVDRLNARDIDLLLLGGDFPAASGAPMRSMTVLGRTQTRDGIFGVDGNHDNFMELFAAMAANGIHPLDNAGLHIRPGFYLAGVADLWRRRPDVARAIQNAAPEDFILLLSHNPDAAMLQDNSRVDVMLSGHTHGGQITFFGLWAPRLWPMPGITAYGHKFKSGWAITPNNTAVFVSRGAGPLETAPRVFARPQVVFITLKPL